MKFWACLAAIAALALAAPPLAQARDERGAPPARAEPYRNVERGRQSFAPPPRAPAYGGYGRGYAAPPPRYERPDAGYGRPAYPAARQPYYPAYPNNPGYRAPAYGGDRYGAPSAYGHLRRGQVLAPAYRGQVINDYGRYHLRRPPRGYAWVRQGDDYVLMGASGMVFEVIPGGGY